MRYIRFMPIILLLLPILFSCNKTLTVNAPWEDVTVVYCLLDQNEDTTFIKITKAYLGEGDALQFAKIPDSSNYPATLDVWLVEYIGNQSNDTIKCDTVTIHNKKPYDDSISFFYYPNQLMYYTKAKLNENYTYKLFVKNKITGKEITSQTELLHSFEVIKPGAMASFPPGKSFEINWEPAKNGKRYQLMIRFFYQEALKTNTDSLYIKWVDWLVFNNVQPVDVSSTQPFDLFFPGDAFYSVVGASIPKDSLVTRVAYRCSYIFTVAATELNTYMEVTEPSLGLVQERPAFTNIVNGIGLFSARFTKSVDSLVISPITKNELKVNANTKDLGF